MKDGKYTMPPITVLIDKIIVCKNYVIARTNYFLKR